MRIPLAEHIDRQLRLERLRDSLMDLDIVVDDARADVDRAVVALRQAVVDRDVAIRDLLAALDAVEAA